MKKLILSLAVFGLLAGISSILGACGGGITDQKWDYGDTPFEDLGLPRFSDLSGEFAHNTGVFENGSSRTDPFRFKKITFDSAGGVIEPTASLPRAMFFLADEVILKSSPVLTVHGTNASGPIGGDGACGGGGGGGINPDVGGGGGRVAQTSPCNGEAGVGGGDGGVGDLISVFEGFAYGLGGNGGDGALGTVAGGSGGSEAQGHGGGGGGGGGMTAAAAGRGGGGGGGLIVVVANSIAGAGILRANGGSGVVGGGASGGAGGGGVIWVAARTYDGLLTAEVNPGDGAGSPGSGTARIFEIKDGDSLVERSFSASW